MKRFVVMMVTALALVACTQPQKTASTTATDKQIREENKLAMQNARNMESPIKGYGCLWPVELSPERVAAPNAISAKCNSLPSGKEYTIRVGARVPAQGVNPDVAMVLNVETAGQDNELVVRFAERLGQRLRYEGKVNGRVPNGGAVDLKLSLVGCVDAAGADVPCPFDNAALFVLAGR